MLQMNEWMTPPPVTTTLLPACSTRSICPFKGPLKTCHTPLRSGASATIGSSHPTRIGGGNSRYPPGGVWATGISVAFTVASERESESFGGLKCSLPVGGSFTDLRIFTGAQISFGNVRKIALSFMLIQYRHHFHLKRRPVMVLPLQAIHLLMWVGGRSSYSGIINAKNDWRPSIWWRNCRV